MVRRLMIPSQIEKEIVIDAPIDVVWRVVTVPEQITHWFAATAELEGRPGGEGRLAFEQGETYYLQVETFEPPHRFAYRWLHDNGPKPRPDNSMLVEFTLQEEAGHTRVRGARGRRHRPRVSSPSVTDERLLEAVADGSRRRVLDLILKHGEATPTAL